MTVENIINDYRVLTQLLHCPSSDIFLVADMSGSSPLAILVIWPSITLTESSDQNEFQQKARGGTIQCQGKTISIRDTGFQDWHPYIITASSYEIRDLLEGQVKSLDQLLQKMQSRYPGDQRVLLNTLLYAFITPASLDEQRSFVPIVHKASIPIENNLALPSEPEAPVSTENAFAGFPTQEPFVPAENNFSPSIMSEPTIRSTGSVSPEFASPSSVDATMLSADSISQAFANPGVPEPTLRSTSSEYPEFASPITPEPAVLNKSNGYPEFASPVTPEPAVLSTSDVFQAFANPTPPTISEPTFRSTSSEYPEFVSAPPIMPNSAFQSTSSASQTMGEMIKPATDSSISLEKGFGAIASTWKGTAKGWRFRKWQVVSVATVLLLLIVGVNILHTTLSATSATITIKPMSNDIRRTYNVKLVAPPSFGDLTVTGRALSSTSQTLTQTVAATGQGHQDATNASGVIVISQINLTNSTGNDELNVSISDNNGVTVTGDDTAQIYNGGVISVPSHASPAGSVGNIVANDMDGNFQIIDHDSGAVIGTAYISNPNPFSGGADAYDYTYVQQSDIDTVANTLTAQLTPGTKAQVKGQTKKNELLDQDPTCTSNVSSDHNANDTASNATVKVNVRCEALAYTNQDLQNSALQAYKTDGNTQLGSGYSIVGATQMSKPTSVAESDDSFSVDIDGIWTFQYTTQSQQELKKSIAGKTASDALQILEQRKDIQHVTLTTEGGFGTAIPTNPAQIKLIIGKMNGLP
jgi:hypothetical protein